MKKVVDTGLPTFGRPAEHATMGGGHLRATVVPLRPDGTFETGDPRTQIELTLSNLKKMVAAAGGTTADVLQALVFLTSRDHDGTLNELWVRHFEPPYPNRGVIIVEGLAIPGVIIMIQLHAYIGD